MADDIVYILKDDVRADELRYSLRSVCENFDFGRVWFYGGCPAGIVPDAHVPFIQVGETKWDRSVSTLAAIVDNDDITEDFYLFNDDFFVLKRYDQHPIVDGGIRGRVAELERRYHGPTRYSARLSDTADWLEENGYGTVNFATHTPLYVNRGAAHEVLALAPASILFRNVYGNMDGLAAVSNDIGDFKIWDHASVPDEGDPLVSTTNRSFADGEVGRYIRARFPEPCRYEKL